MIHTNLTCTEFDIGKIWHTILRNFFKQSNSTSQQHLKDYAITFSP